ncbi:MAG: hypothetical protein IKB21_02695 [Clostridia bacterium]|nr:hypothetical protein [Clostridia bacterium]MBR2221354.1 hypothetical protein [Clostridia bacterium]MBR2433499.1 hypothetical protein [Clostridia bacterium]
MKFLKWFFNFGEKYRKKEEEYAQKSRKFGTSGELIALFFLSAVPLLSLWGMFSNIALGWKLLLIVGVVTIFYIPGELMVMGIVALRHRMKMKAINKVHGAMMEKTTEILSGEEVTGENKEKFENYKAKGTAPKYDLAVGICGIALSVLVVVAFVALFFLFVSQTI